MHSASYKNWSNSFLFCKILSNALSLLQDVSNALNLLQELIKCIYLFSRFYQMHLAFYKNFKTCI